MTLKEALKQNKLLKSYYDNYISLYDESDHRFYGTFVGDEKLEEYFDYEIATITKLFDKSNIWKVKVINYNNNLGLDSIRRSEDIKNKILEAKKKSKL